MYVLFYKQGPYEVGNIILGFDGVTQIMLALANSDNPLHQVQPQCQRSRPHDLSISSLFSFISLTAITEVDYRDKIT